MIILFRGPAGSFKSTMAQHLADGRPLPHSFFDTPLGDYLRGLRGVLEEYKGERQLFASDNHFMVDGEYRFDPAQLSAAHNSCLRQFQNWVSDTTNILIVENTNTTIAEAAAYLSLGCAFGHEIRVITLLADPILAWRRNVHQVPLTNVIKQDLQLRASILEWPPWWPQQIFPVPT